jgi:hypothetical protein
MKSAELRAVAGRIAAKYGKGVGQGDKVGNLFLFRVDDIMVECTSSNELTGFTVKVGSMLDSQAVIRKHFKREEKVTNFIDKSIKFVKEDQNDS